MSATLLALLAAAPILAVLALMLGPGWSAARAGAVGLALATLLALTAFDLAPGGTGPEPAAAEARALLGASAEAGFTAATILWILLPALAIHGLGERTGRLDALRRALSGLSPDPVLGAVLIGFFFALFIEGAAGFGTPVALAAPLLVALGLPPERALAAALIGHAAGVSFGAVGTPIQPQIQATDLSGEALAVWPAILTALLAPILLVFVLRIAGATRAPQWRLGLLAAPLFLLPFAAIAILVGPELPTLAGALLGGLLFAALLRRRAGGAAAPAVPAPELWRAAAPYLLLVALIAATRLAPPLREALQPITWEWRLWGRFEGSFAPLYHPGTLLMAAFLLGAAITRTGARDVGAALAGAARRLLPVLAALLVMLGLARVLVHAGMVERLAEGAAAGVGVAWPLAAPFVGALGTFVTGSATTSNILFTELQMGVAASLGLSAPLILGAQTFGAAVGNIVCPHNIVAGCATVGIAGREGAVMRRTLPAALLYAAAGGLVAWGAGRLL